jgi:hypothetical protein
MLAPAAYLLIFPFSQIAIMFTQMLGVITSDEGFGLIHRGHTVAG